VVVVRAVSVEKDCRITARLRPVCLGKPPILTGEAGRDLRVEVDIGLELSVTMPDPELLAADSNASFSCSSISVMASRGSNPRARRPGFKFIAPGLRIHSLGEIGDQ
jgi:hypothetical protein